MECSEAVGDRGCLGEQEPMSKAEALVYHYTSSGLT